MPFVHQNFVAAVVMELVMIAHINCCVVVPPPTADVAIDCTSTDFVDSPLLYLL